MSILARARKSFKDKCDTAQNNIKYRKDQNEPLSINSENVF
jgi:hypothetical protein